MSTGEITTEWRFKVQEVIEQIKKECYYLHLWEQVKHKKPLEECTEKSELLKPFQDFWELLPDTMSIQRAPFTAICDLAEEFIFGDGPQ